jgi:hypothetical protein
MFDPQAFGPEIAALLGDGCRIMPLVRVQAGVPGMRERIQAATASPLLRAGLCVYFDYWDAAHEIAQDIETPEGSYWHAIVHRQEPDAGNASYWFRLVGHHPIFPALRTAATELGLPAAPTWDPFAFIAYCTSGDANLARQVQLAEWQLLFDWCAASNAR